MIKVCKEKRCGYTFMELLLCLGVIMILGYGSVVGVRHYYNASRYDIAKSDLSVVAMAVSKYHFETGSYPENLDVLTIRKVPYGPWITKEKLVDPWGNRYNYLAGTDRYALWSCGVDEREQSGNPLSGGFGGDDIGEIRK